MMAETLGCVMIEAQVDWIPRLPLEWAYVPEGEDPALWGIPDRYHLTLKYGLIPELVTEADAYLKLAGWEAPPVVHVTDVRDFTADYTAYSCPVLLLEDADHKFARAHDLLSALPHIDTHPAYHPHITLGYVRPQNRRFALAMVAADIDDIDVRFGAVFMSGLSAEDGS